jgi:hypothetical protein
VGGSGPGRGGERGRTRQGGGGDADTGRGGVKYGDADASAPGCARAVARAER